MKVLFDTSVLVAATIEAHPAHDRALPWLKKAKARSLDYLVASHSLAELYAVLSSLPTTPRVSPGLARRLIHENVEKLARVIPLSARDYSIVLRTMAELGLSGGAVYDVLISRAAQKAKADRLLTLNPRDFLRVWPEALDVITGP